MNSVLRLASRVTMLLLACAAGAAAQQVDWSKKALQSERSRAYDALHYRIAIRLDLDEKSFAGETTVTLTSLRDGLDTVVLDAEEFAVTKVVSEWGEPLEFSQSEKELSIRMARPLARGETRSFTCTYRGKDPKAGAAVRCRDRRQPRARVLGFVAQPGPPLVSVLRLPERQGHQRDSSRPSART